MNRTSRVPVAFVLAAILLASCSTKAEDPTKWCNGYLDFSYAMLDWDSSAAGSAEQSQAEQRIQTVGEALTQVEVPKAIENDFEIVIAGPDPADGGDSHLAAIRRMNDWLIVNCDWPAEFVELLEMD